MLSLSTRSKKTCSSQPRSESTANGVMVSANYFFEQWRRRISTQAGLNKQNNLPKRHNFLCVYRYLKAEQSALSEDRF